MNEPASPTQPRDPGMYRNAEQIKEMAGSHMVMAEEWLEKLN